MPDYRVIYSHHAAEYDRLIRCEDAGGAVLTNIRSLVAVSDARVIDVGAGTGRLALALAASGAREVKAFDAAPAMLEVLAQHARDRGLSNVSTEVADNESLPVESGWADVALAGWSFGHATGFFPGAWQPHIERSVDELIRIVRPGGIAIILETLGTGSIEGVPPRPALAEYYAWLESQRGFEKLVLTTDYVFASVREAEQLVRFFFGDALGDRMVDEQLTSLPERTGLWWRRTPRDAHA